MKSFCIVGLGNPGEKYRNTFHNIGFAILDAFLALHNSEQKFSFSKKHNAEIAEISLAETKVILVKPQTFMNKSGFAARSVLDFYKLDPFDNLLVVHDDLDLPFGKIRFSQDSGPAGHNGVSSVVEQLGSQNFVRLRFGIAREEGSEYSESAETFVLKNFSTQQQKQLPELLQHCAKSIRFFVDNGFAQTATEFNQNN